MNAKEIAEIVDRLEFNHFQPSGLDDTQRDAIAAALEKYRDEGLESAAKIADDKAQERKDVYATGLAEWCACNEVRESIRCLKSKGK